MAVTAWQAAWPVIYMLISTLGRSALIINTEVNISYENNTQNNTINMTRTK